MKSEKTGAAGRGERVARARYFTLEQARRALPLVRRIAADIVEQHRTLRALQSRRRALPAKGREAEVRAVDEQGNAVALRLTQLVEEMQEVGCELKDPKQGLVDFPALHQGRRIELCWMLGEETIDFWHESSAGFAGRERVETLT